MKVRNVMKLLMAILILFVSVLYLPLQLQANDNDQIDQSIHLVDSNTNFNDEIVEEQVELVEESTMSKEEISIVDENDENLREGEMSQHIIQEESEEDRVKKASITDEKWNSNMENKMEMEERKVEHTLQKDNENVTTYEPDPYADKGLELDSSSNHHIQGLLDVAILERPNLEASLSETPEGKPKITLNYVGWGLLNISLLKNTYIIFNVPPEITNATTKVSASYDVPAVGLLIPIIRKKGTFNEDEIKMEDNQFIINFNQIVAVDLLSVSDYRFSLTIELDYLPLTSDGNYYFMSQATKQIIDLSVLSSDSRAATTLTSPVLKFQQVPNTIQFQSTPIPVQPQVINREEDLFQMSVIDTRGRGSTWKIHARLNEPLTLRTDSMTYTLPNALKFVRDLRY